MSAECAGKVLAGLRRAVVEAKAAHRGAEDHLKITQARAEADAIEERWVDYGALKNKDDRDRWLLIQLHLSGRYLEALGLERAARTEVDRLHAEIEIHVDAHKDREAMLRSQEIANKALEIALQGRMADLAERQMEPVTMFSSGGVAHG